MPFGDGPPRSPRVIPTSTCVGALHDDDPAVVEVAAWSCGEHESNRDAVLDRLIALAGSAGDALVREAAVAALGAIGDERGLPAIIVATADKPAVRRRAVLALAPFDGDEVDAAIDRALEDRDWQVRQAAEDLERASDDRDVLAIEAARPRSERVAVHVGLAGDEAETQVQAVRRLARRAARQAHVLGATPARLRERGLVQAPRRRRDRARRRRRPRLRSTP